MFETETETETVTGQPTATLREKIREVITAAAAPLKLKDLKNELKAAGVPLSGKKKVTEEEIQQALDLELQDRNAFEHEGKKFGAKPPLTLEEQTHSLREKIREVIADAAAPLKLAELKERLRVAGVSKTGDQKVSDKEIVVALEIEVRDRRVFEHAGNKYGATAPLTVEEQFEKTMREKVAALGEKLVPEEKLGKPKPAEGEERHIAFKKILDKLLAEKVLFAHGDKFGAHAPVSAEEKLEPIVRAKVAALGEKVVAEEKLGKPKPEESEERHSAFKKVLEKLLAAKVLFAHGEKFGTNAPQSAEEQLEPIVRAKVAALGEKLVLEEKLGKPKPAESEERHIAFKKILDKLLAEKVLFAHGAKFGRHAPKVFEWYETGPNKKPFASLVGAARKVLGLDAVTVEMVLDALRDQLRVPVVQKAPVAVPAPEPSPPPKPIIDLRTAIREAYDHLCEFAEFQDRLVEIPRLYTETCKRVSGLTVADFHQEIEALNKEWLVELHELNEVKDAKNKQYAIERDDRLYYFIRWK